MNWRELQRKNITLMGGAVSGGLDSCTVTHWLTSNGFEVHGFTVDLGQPDEENLDAVKDRMVACGAQDATILPGRAPLAAAGLKVIQSQARYEGGYWNTTGIARPVTVAAILPELARRDVGVLFHGATGRGNDQVRFQLASNMIDPNLEVYAPWRDPEFIERFPGRQQMIEYCEANDLPIRPARESRYSTDANFLGLTHEAGDLEDVTISPDFVEPGMGVWPWDAPDRPQFVTVRWEQGVPVALNGERLDLEAVFLQANRIGGAQGVGIGDHVVENRFVGVKSRGIYEAPAMELLGKSYEFLLQFILDRRAREFFDYVSGVISLQIYQGYWLDLATRAALAALEPITRMVTGTITMRLYKGGVYFDTVEDTPEAMPHSLYTDDSSMEAMGAYDHSDAEGFLKVLGISAKNLGARQGAGTDD
ncbi:MAG: argininosuccinate synthase [SAR202 cluster bacterium]|nr:argininosuccinate synthase [SAR202 cluster bacterium]MDP6799335.1 argininosuccinate synthase [SAR202 cluster bacterium]